MSLFNRKQPIEYTPLPTRQGGRRIEVTDYDGLLTAINDARTSQTTNWYIVNIDATGWTYEERQYLDWLETNRKQYRDRITINKIKR